MNYAFFGHHKCASTSTSHLCFDVCNSLGLNPVYKKTAFHENVGTFFLEEHPNFLISLNSRYENISQLTNFKGFHIIRDPRDICVSGYFSHLHSHGIDGFDRLKPHREALKKVDKDKGLLLEFEFADFWLQHLSTWNYQDERILELKLEDLMKNPEAVWLKVFKWLQLYDTGNHNALKRFFNPFFAKLNHGFRHLGIINFFLKEGLDHNQLLEIVGKYSFKNLSKGRKMGQEDIKSHYRKGQQGDWMNHFNSKHKEVFKEKYGQLLIDLGYEKDLNW